MKDVLRAAAGVLIFALAALVWVQSCSGPQPGVVGTPRVQAPERPGDPYTVEAVIRNVGPGRGDVNVTFRLFAPAPGQSYVTSETAQLDRDEVVHVVAEIRAPSAAYEPRVERGGYSALDASRGGREDLVSGKRVRRVVWVCGPLARPTRATKRAGRPRTQAYPAAGRRCFQVDLASR